MAEIPIPSVEQAGQGTVWFTSVAGITATVLAFVALGLAVAYVWERMSCRKEIAANNKLWVDAIERLTKAWGERIDQIRGDTKEAFGQNGTLAEKMVEAMNTLKIEVARMSARREQ